MRDSICADLAGLSPKMLAKALTERYQTCDPFLLCEELDILVVEVALPKEVNGFYSSVGGCSIVYLSEELEEHYRRVVCAHELGHVLMHEGCNIFFLLESTLLPPGRFEREADTFCAYLLLGDLEPAFGQGETIEWIARQTGVPQRIVALRYPEIPQ